MLNLIYTITVVTITLLCVMAVLTFKTKITSSSKYLLIILIVCAIGNRIDMLPQQLPPERFFELVGQFFGAFSAGVTWLFAMSLMRDKYRFNLTSVLVLLVSSAIPLMYFLTHVDVLPHISSFYWHFHMPIMVVIVLHVVWTGIAGFKDDLIDLRRQARIWLCALPIFLISVNVVAEYSVNEERQVVVYLFAEFLGVSVLLFLLANFNEEVLKFSSDVKLDNQPSKNNALNIHDKDKAAYRRLMTLIEEEQIYLNDNLSMSALAENVGIPEHQLRGIINQGLGHKNFSTFLAGYRIAHVKLALSDPQQARVPIMTIALNNGFSSLATFNRLFKLETGMAAGEFRKRVLRNL